MIGKETSKNINNAESSNKQVFLINNEFYCVKGSYCYIDIDDGRIIKHTEIKTIERYNGS